MLTLFVAPFSTNCERVALALGHKNLTAERIEISYDDRSPVERVSGQPYVPVLDHDGEILTDSSRIIEHLDRRFPEPPLFAQPEARFLIDWFNRAWKREPNQIAAELEKPDGERDSDAIARWSRRLQERLDWFESLLADGRPYLLGDAFSAADCSAWPFLRFAAGRPAGDDELFHVVCDEYQPATPEAHPRLLDWIERVDQQPRG